MRDNQIYSDKLEEEDRVDTGRGRIGGYEKEEDTKSDADTEIALLELYLEELKAVPPVGELRKKELMQAASNGTEEARTRLAEVYLMQAVQMAAAYCGQGVGFADLVQEANVGLMEAMLGDPITEEAILESIEAALKRALEEEGREVKTGEKMATRLNRMSDAAAELAERYGREATVEELAAYLCMSVEEVQMGMKISLEAIDFSTPDV